MPGMKFLDPKVLRSIAHVELRARLLVEGMYASRHRCPYYGYSVEFKDHREYSPGDEPRTIDWKMLARTERYFVKRFEMESNMNVVSILDVSGSMGYRPGTADRLNKLEYGNTVAAAISYLVSQQQDSPGLVTFDEGIRDFIPARQGRRHLYTILSRLEAIQPGGLTDLAVVLRRISQRLRRRGIVLILSDCYGDPRQVTDGIRHLVVHGHEVVLFQIMDTDEVTFPFQALSSFRDMETGRQVMGDPLRQRRRYLDRLERFCGDIRSGCAAAGADYRFLQTSEPIELVLRDYLFYRRKQAR